jgi:hypothetical protein
MSLSPAQAYEALETVHELERLIAANGIFFYKPHAKQDKFHRAGEFKRRYVRTGNRFGKSEMGTAEDIAWALGERPWYDINDPARYAGIPRKSNVILVLCQDWDKVHEVFTCNVPGQSLGKIFKFLPEEYIAQRPVKSKSGVISEVHVKSIWGGTSLIKFDTVKSFLSNEAGQESSDFDAIHVDEPIPKEMWVANARGLMDRNGSAWFTCTPLNQPWINEMFVPPEKTRQDIDGELIYKDNYWMITGSTNDNPHNSAESIAMFEADLTDAQKQCRLHGLPLTLSGIVYKQFNRSTHVYTRVFHKWEAMNRPPKDYTIRVNVDPHPETPHAVLFYATAPNGQTFYYDEIFEQCIASTLCQKINAILDGYDLYSIYMDPAGFIESPTDGSSMADVFDSYGLFVEKAPKDLTRGIVETQMMLNRVVHTPTGQKVPKLCFGEHMTRTLYEFDAYQWDPKKPNKPRDKDDHMMENLYRSVLQGLDYVKPEKIVKRMQPREFGSREGFFTQQKLFNK